MYGTLTRLPASERAQQWDVCLWCEPSLCSPPLRTLLDSVCGGLSALSLVVQVLNETFSDQLREYLSPHFSLDDASFISIDATGADVRVRLGSEFNVERLGFDQKVNNLDEAITAVRHVLEY